LEGLLKYPGGGLAKDRRDAGQIPVSFGIPKKPAGFVTGKKNLRQPFNSAAVAWTISVVHSTKSGFVSSRLDG